MGDDVGLMDLETSVALLATWIAQAALAYYTWTLKKVAKIGSDRQLALDIRKQVGTDDKLFAEYWATRPSEYLWITHAVAFCGILEGGAWSGVEPATRFELLVLHRRFRPGLVPGRCHDYLR